jgi:hypothetical protein
MNFTFTMTDPEDGSSTVRTFSTEYLPTVIENFDSFVRGCGFFPQGEIQDVDTDYTELSPLPEDRCEL